jgi:hypothetical protein
MMLYHVHSSLASTEGLTVDLVCGADEGGIFTQTRASAGVRSVEFALSALPIDIGSVSCSSTLRAGAVTLASSSLSFTVLASSSKYQTTVDFERRAVIVDSRPFLPFGFGTQAPGATARAIQAYLSTRGVNNFMHYFFEDYTAAARDDWAAVLDDAAQLGSWVQAQAADKLGAFTKSDSAQQSAFSLFAKEMAQQPAVWSYYVADDTINNISAHLQLLSALSEADPFHITIKAQADTALGYSLSTFADITEGEA